MDDIKQLFIEKETARYEKSLQKDEKLNHSFQLGIREAYLLRAILMLKQKNPKMAFLVRKLINDFIEENTNGEEDQEQLIRDYISLLSDKRINLE